MLASASSYRSYPIAATQSQLPNRMLLNIALYSTLFLIKHSSIMVEFVTQ